MSKSQGERDYLANKEATERLTANGGSAFPVAVPLPSGGTFTSIGMSLRDWYAGQAMAGMMANGFMPSQFSDRAESGDHYGRWDYAAAAYAAADAMLAARQKGGAE